MPARSKGIDYKNLQLNGLTVKLTTFIIVISVHRLQSFSVKEKAD
jgi:hypothetical protein